MPRSKEGKWQQQLCRGEATAWLQLMEHWSPCLYNYLLYQGITETAAQTLLHAIFAEIVHSVVGQLRVTNLTVLIFSIASQHALQHHRQSAPSSLTPQRPTRSFADTIPDQQRAFLRRLQQFAPEVQQLLLLYYLYEVTLPEIAQIVGQPIESLQKVLQRFKPYLR